LPPLDVDIDETCTNRKIFADRLLEKVFYNLFENSLRHAGAGTKIRISISCLPDQDHVMLVHEDTGPGIPYEEKMKLFVRGYGKIPASVFS